MFPSNAPRELLHERVVLVPVQHLNARVAHIHVAFPERAFPRGVQHALLRAPPLRVVNHVDDFPRGLPPRHRAIVRVVLHAPRSRRGPKPRRVPVQVVFGNERDFPLRDRRVLVQRVRRIGELPSRLGRGIPVPARSRNSCSRPRRTRSRRRNQDSRQKSQTQAPRARRSHKRACSAENESFSASKT